MKNDKTIQSFTIHCLNNLQDQILKSRDTEKLCLEEIIKLQKRVKELELSVRGLDQYIDFQLNNPKETTKWDKFIAEQTGLAENVL